MGLILNPSSGSEILDLGLWFSYEHLPEGRVRDASQLCADLAQQMVDTLPVGHQLTKGLDKLLEAKDAFVRSALMLERELRG